MVLQHDNKLQDILTGKLSDYKVLIESISEAPPGENLELGLLKTLVCRDEIAQILDESRGIPIEQLLEAIHLDEELKNRITTKGLLMEQSRLANWRDTFQPPASAWWWSMDERIATKHKQRTALWVIITGFALTLSITIGTDISTRFFSGGPDKLGILSTSTQVFLALIAGSSFTEVGRQWLGSVFSGFHIKIQHQNLAMVVFAVFVLAVIVGFRYSLPAIAKHYNNQALAGTTEGRMEDAIDGFRRAVALNPDYPEAHYNLARLYEELQDSNKAIDELRRAIETNPKFDAAYNDLARLYISTRADYRTALDLLSKLFTLEMSAETRQVAHKNRGWAFFGLEYFELAKDDLTKAIALCDQAEAHALLGEVLFKQGAKQEASKHWHRCLELVRQRQEDQGPEIDAKLLALVITHLAGEK